MQTGSEVYEIVNMIGIFYDTTSNSHDQAKRKGMVTRWKNQNSDPGSESYNCSIMENLA